MKYAQWISQFRKAFIKQINVEPTEADFRLAEKFFLKGILPFIAAEMVIDSNHNPDNLD
jgi:hypothetical protein